jgi:arginyl-tRNA synthetase
MFEQEIINSLKEYADEVILEKPPANLGDYAFPCFSLAKEMKKSPAQIAQELAEKITKPDFIEKIVATGPYVNFFLDKEKLAKPILSEIFEKKNCYGATNEGNNEIVAIDLSHPNIGKPFHFGHLRSTIIGESIARMLEFRGYTVQRLNYLGDWGTQFGALMYAFKHWGDSTKLNHKPIEYLVELYVKFHDETEKNPDLKAEAKAWFAKLEQGDEEATQLWGTFKSLSLKEYKRIYDILGSKFDSFRGESEAAREVDQALDIVKKKGVTEIDEGALIVRLENYDAPIILRKDDGSSTYASRDVAELMFRLHNLKANKVLYCVGHDQSLHFTQVFDLMDKLGHPKENFAHIKFGLYRTEEGKLSTRKGRIVLMEDVLNDAIGLAQKTIEQKNPNLESKEETARRVGVSAIIFGDIANDRIKDVQFNLQKILSFEGDTGPYLMYTHARAASIIRKGAEFTPSEDVKSNLLVHDSEQKLLKNLLEFSSKISEALQEYKPHVIAQYLLELAHSFNEFYHNCPCLSEKDEDLKHARLSLIEASRQVIENGLRLLGITAPFEM